MVDKQVNFAPDDIYAADSKEAERLDLEAHARLEAGLTDSFPASDLVSAVQPAPTIAPLERRSIWHSIRQLFKKPR
jgi:hypothetical protein